MAQGFEISASKFQDLSRATDKCAFLGVQSQAGLLVNRVDERNNRQLWSLESLRDYSKVSLIPIKECATQSPVWENTVNLTKFSNLHVT